MQLKGFEVMCVSLVSAKNGEEFVANIICVLFMRCVMLFIGVLLSIFLLMAHVFIGHANKGDRP